MEQQETVLASYGRADRRLGHSEVTRDLGRQPVRMDVRIGA